jgi:hypothetical protein
VDGFEGEGGSDGRRPPSTPYAQVAYQRSKKFSIMPFSLGLSAMAVYAARTGVTYDCTTVGPWSLSQVVLISAIRLT